MKIGPIEHPWIKGATQRFIQQGMTKSVFHFKSLLQTLELITIIYTLLACLILVH